MSHDDNVGRIDHGITVELPESVAVATRASVKRSRTALMRRLVRISRWAAVQLAMRDLGMAKTAQQTQEWVSRTGQQRGQ